MPNKGRLLKKSITAFLLILIVIGCIGWIKPHEVSAASKYVSRKQMIQMILTELNVSYDTSNDDYVEKAKDIGLLTKSTFSNYDKYLTKVEAAMLLVRADEYLYGKSLEESLINKIIDCRISDINKIRKVYRPYLAKAYALGYIKGNSNGTYSTNRKFNPTYRITMTYAKQLVSLIQNKNQRHQISPDGQLIRTTNLPKMAEFYPYILASYPNSYYDWQFLFMRARVNEKPIYGTNLWVSKEAYAAPIDFSDYRYGEDTFYYYYSNEKISSKELYEICIDQWEMNAKEYLNCIFNFDYRFIDDNPEWKERLLLVDYNGTIDSSNTMNKIEQYIKYAKENKTIVESDIIALDRSSAYICDGYIYLRAYVKFKICNANNILFDENSPLLYTRYPYPQLSNISINKWHECYINVQVTSGVPNYGVQQAIINDYFHNNWVVEL